MKVHAWQMSYAQVRETLEKASTGTRSEWESINPLLAELYPEGVPLGRPDYCSLSRRHKAAIQEALQAGKDIPSTVIGEYFSV